MNKSISILYNNKTFKKVDILRNGEVLLQEDFYDLKVEKIHHDRYYFLKTVSDLHASEFVKFANLDENGAATILFESCRDRTDRKYNKYFASMHKISRLLFDNILLMYKELPFITSISMTIPYEKYQLLVEVDRETMELFLQKQITLRQQHNQQHTEPNHSDQDLTEFIQQFVKVKK